ncbi:MAG TPA: helix-turn-helix domain-containing protein [Flexivirga sp.]|uniref:PucR family transcriptional regulator n=1 Tax=Flexivirga sp. TaxID=1962927 RepID=UPI002C3D6379|nr:helix-turn-helix domain-containing protein [Flexivirga sp.]HWC21419.1 helix-turn-helix domain-containing protein [Flexivirga sp.]
MADRTTLGTIVERLGLTLLTTHAGVLDRERRTSGVVLFDPTDPPDIPQDSVVLGVGVQGADAIEELLSLLMDHRASALVVREPVHLTERIVERATAGEVALLGLVRGASWIQVAGILDGSRHEGDGVMAPANDGLDLFEVANALSELLNAPVTVEDIGSHILAFSADQGDADEARKASVLGHQVPRRYNDRLIERGAFRRLYASREPIYITSIGDGIRPRSAVRICAGDEVLGSIWAVVDAPLSARRAAAMSEAASTAAIAMLRNRMAADASSRWRAAAVSALIEGGAAAQEAVAKMRNAVTGGCVLAVGLREETMDDAAASAELERLAGALRMLLHSEIPTALAAVLGDTVYAVVPAHEHRPVDVGQLRRLATEFARRSGRGCERVVVSIGTTVAAAAALDRSRRDADLALRVLRATNDVPDQVVLAADVQVQGLLMRMSDLLIREEATLSGPIAALRSYDERHQSALEETLRAWLDHFGDVGTAATTLHVHKNTFRYRLGRVVELTGVDLTDPEVRFRLMLQFRLTA